MQNYIPMSLIDIIIVIIKISHSTISAFFFLSYASPNVCFFCCWCRHSRRALVANGRRRADARFCVFVVLFSFVAGWRKRALVAPPCARCIRYRMRRRPSRPANTKPHSFGQMHESCSMTHFVRIRSLFQPKICVQN